ncbi:hypothetical protein Kisp02_01610 [Kineosporia sp. NBRC 101731]|nr:hypothetical protein Kisp02_01610 [Kineosporia sp. NBRC 101731]
MLMKSVTDRPAPSVEFALRGHASTGYVFPNGRTCWMDPQGQHLDLVLHGKDHIVDLTMELGWHIAQIAERWGPTRRAQCLGEWAA